MTPAPGLLIGAHTILNFWNTMAKPLQAVMRTFLNAITSSGNEIGELQKDKLVERRVR